MWLGKAILVDRNGPAFLEMLGSSGDYDAKLRSKIRCWYYLSYLANIAPLHI